MKKHLLIAATLLLATGAFAKKVKFSVDMSGLVKDTAGIHVTGDFQDEAGYAGGDWMTNTSLMTQDPNDTNIYNLVVDIPAFRHYEFKFVNGAQGYDQEFVPYESRVNYNFVDSRWIYVDSLSNDTLSWGAIRFGGNAPMGKYLARFYVDMSNVASVSSSGVHVTGAFQSWNAGSTRLFSFDGSVYEYIAYFDSTQASVQDEYRFVNGNANTDMEQVPGWCVNANGNRETTVPKDTLLPVVCYAGCASCAAAGIASIDQQQGIRVYPNPVSSSAVMEINKAWTSVQLCDLSGRVLRNYGYDGKSNLLLEKADLRSGLYLLRLYSGNQCISDTKLIITP